MTISTTQCSLCACPPPYANCAGTNADGGCARIAGLETKLPAQKGFSDGEIIRLGYQLDDVNSKLARYEQAAREFPVEPVSCYQFLTTENQIKVLNYAIELRATAAALKANLDVANTLVGEQKAALIKAEWNAYEQATKAGKAEAALAAERKVSANLADQIYDARVIRDEAKAALAAALDQRGTLFGFINPNGSWQWTELGSRICRLEKELVASKADWFRKGQESIRRQNESGCCCKLDDDGEEIISPCDAHRAWRDMARAQEGEECAKVCEQSAKNWSINQAHGGAQARLNYAVEGHACARAIRDRYNEPHWTQDMLDEVDKDAAMIALKMRSPKMADEPNAAGQVGIDTLRKSEAEPESLRPEPVFAAPINEAAARPRRSGKERRIKNENILLTTFRARLSVRRAP